MLYVLEVGPVEQSIIKQAIRAGDPIPDRIANAPELKYGLNLYFQAFFDLDSERSHGFSVGRIGWLAIKEYALTFGFDATQTEDLFCFIRAMDCTYMDWVKEKADKK